METRNTKIGIFVSGFAFILLGLALIYFLEDIIFFAFEQEMPLKPNSHSFSMWKLTPVPIKMSVYFWNWTNPHEIDKKDRKPIFVEVGPYVFSEIHEKVNITWNHNGTVTYRVIKRWYFDEENTNGSLSDNITSVNAVAASVAYIGRSWSRFFLYPVSAALRTSGQELSWTKNVSELLFEGFDNSIQNIGSYIPGFPALDKFGWFYKRNGTLSSDIYTIGTGENSLKELGKLKFWNNRNSTSRYESECSKIEGFVGDFWPPKRTKEDSLPMYTTDMCRKINYYFEEESSYSNMKTFVYSGTKETVDNGSVIKENKCYCDSDFCPPSGVFDVSKCQYGAPIFMSYPHFYNADPSYGNSIEGMSPDKEKHRFYLAVEPRTGLQVDVRARMQINVYLKRNPSLSLFRDVKDVFIPVLWLENSVSLSKEYTDGIETMLATVKIGPFIYYGICVLGCAIIFGGILLHFFVLNRNMRLRNKNGKGSVRKSEDVQMADGRGHVKEVEYTFSEIKC